MEAYISGYVSPGYNGIVLSPYSDWICNETNLSEWIQSVVGYSNNYSAPLGGKVTTTHDFFMNAYFTDTEMSYDEAETAFLEQLDMSGDLFINGHYTGYSEWTITGYDIDTCYLGGHDLKRELDTYNGKYANIKIEY